MSIKLCVEADSFHTSEKDFAYSVKEASSLGFKYIEPEMMTGRCLLNIYGYCCLPHYLHAQATVKAADSGKHVICEKPMAINLEQGRQMLQACEENNRILMIALQSRYASINAKFKEMIDEGVLGKMFLVRVMQGFHPGLRDFHYKKDKIGGGVLISTGIHVIDLTRWFAGDVKRLSYAGNSLIRGLEGEDTAVMTLEFENGAIGSLVSSWATKPSATHFWIHGEKGALTTEGGLRFIDSEGEVLQPEVDKTDPFKEELEHYVDCIVKEKEPLTSGEEGYKSLKVAVGAYQSEKESRMIDLAEL